MKINVFTSILENMHEDIYKITVPRIHAYATAIGADFFNITERKFPEFGDFFEKMQIFELGKDADWNIYISPDVVLHDGMLDMTKECPIDRVGHWGGYGGSSWFQMDDDFWTDLITNDEGQQTMRDIAFTDSILCVPKACHVVWQPTDLPYEVAIMKAGRRMWLGEWNLAKNVAKHRMNVIQFQSRARKNGAQSDKSCFIALEVLRNRVLPSVAIEKAITYLQSDVEE